MPGIPAGYLVACPPFVPARSPRSAARLNEPDLALDLMVGKYQTNPFMVSGYARGYDKIPVCLPANGSWLSAVAMMAAGWDGGPSGSAPGFPSNWRVRWEGLSRMP
jgi:hypothetical protein